MMHSALDDGACQGLSAASVAEVRALDDVDLRLLLALVDAPRASAVALAERLGLSRNTVRARLNAVIRDGGLLSFDRCIAPEAAGCSLTAFITLQVRQRLLTETIAAIARIPEVVQAHGVTGSADLLVRVACASSADLFRVEEAILGCSGVERAETALGVSEVIPYRMVPLLQQRLEEQGSR